MNQNNLDIVVSALLSTRIVNGETQILNVLAYNKQHFGFPGGKLETGETPEEAILRETREELGVTPTEIKHIDTFCSKTPEGRNITMHVFIGKLPEEISPNREIKELHWLTYNQMCGQKERLTPITIECILPILEKL